MKGDVIITVTQNIARVFDIFQVDRGDYRIIDEAACIPFNPPEESVRRSEIIVENVVRPPIKPPLTEVQEEKRKEANNVMRRFRTMSVFSGAGGMDIGMAQTGAFRTECAIDTCPKSAATFTSHHPDGQFLCMDAGAALQQRVGLGMPKPGEVDVMLLGPPCQPFSTLNRKYREDSYNFRSLLVATGLSYVDVYRPTYGCIENVCGMLYRGSCGSVKRQGTIRFISACLEAMGYNVRFCKVQCGYYGIPQSRARVKILFALKSVTLPSAPVPTTKLAGHHPSKGGPGPAVTIADATSDLPRWEYRNPHLYYSPEWTMQDSRPIARRPRQLSTEATKGSVGLANCTYVTAPINDFQRSVRPGHYANPNAIVQQHVTSALNTTHVERIHNIRFKAGANHVDLVRYNRSKLSVANTKELKTDAAYKRAYQRLDANGPFQIVTTNLTLESKLGKRLLPTQKRIPTVRELARAQGFPDAITFRGSAAESIRQIGNAVPCGLSRAIGLTIREAAIDDCLAGDLRFRRQRL